MKLMLGAAVAAVTMAGAGSAAADVTIFQDAGSGYDQTRVVSLSSPGLYRATITSSAPAFLESVAEWIIHWDTFLAPPPKPHSDFIEGNTSDGFAGGGLFGTYFSFDFTIPEETYRWFQSSTFEEFAYGIPVGSLMYKWTRPENISISFHFDDDGAGVLTDYSFNLIRVSAVPEPATWAIMIIGFAGSGIALRRARHATLATRLA